jgi:hypothetical protein
MLTHPRHATLNRFSDGTLPARRRRRVADHLAVCRRCRGEVAFIRQAGARARSLEAPEPPEDLLEKILARRAAGERVILPLTSPGRRAYVKRRAVPAVAALVALLGAGLFVSTGLLEADRPVLRLEPTRPQAGDTLSVVYDGGLGFEGLDWLQLRVRFRTAAGHASQHIGGILERGPDQKFHTRLPLPDSVVYAAFAVESLDGARVDHNHKALWDVMVHGPDGRPTLAALTQRYLDVESRDSLAVRETVAAMIDLYPESPRGWWAEAVPGSRGTVNERAAQERLARLRVLERRYTEQPPADPEELAFMAWFAATLRDPASAQHWTAEAERRGARSRWLAQAKLVRVAAYDRLPPDQALQELEAIWQEAPIPVPNVADFGWANATRAGNWDAALRWLPRYRETRGAWPPVGVLDRLRDAFGPDSTLSWALAHADDELFRTAAYRPLNRTEAEHARSLDDARQEMLASMASMAIATGRHELGRALALEGLGLSWQSGPLTAIGTILLAAGDTADAVTAFARVAADPAGGPVPAAVTSSPGWAESLETARYGLIQRVLEESVVQYPDAGLGPTSGPSVVAFLNRCDETARVLEDLPPAMVTVYATINVDSVRHALATCGLDLPVRPDPGGRIGRAFGLRAFTALFVTDGQGRVRFSHSNTAELPRQLMALEDPYGLADD